MKILIVDDHHLFSDALSLLVQKHCPEAEISVANCIASAMELLEQKPEQDLVLLDLRMPGMRGLEGITTVKTAYPDLKVALISGMISQTEIQQAFDLGVVGVLLKVMSGGALYSAVQLMISGERYIPSAMIPSQNGAKNHGSLAEGAVLQPLSFREKEVLRQLILGQSNKEIARSLGIQETTVKLHVRTLSQKLEARNRTDVVIKAIKGGIVSL